LKRTRQRESLAKVAKGSSEVETIAASAASVDWEGVEEVTFLVRPWLRVDGTLNRRVLDRLLGAVLGHVMQRPGSTAAAVADRFAPALQPTHCLDLVDILRELGCLKVWATRKNNGTKGGLFAPPPKMHLAEPTLLDVPEDLLIEPEVDAVVTLGQFIGDKQYSMDFVCQCPCHPDKKQLI